jgi:hypothetical protein
LNSIEGVTLFGSGRQPLNGRQQTIIRRLILQIELLAAGHSKSGGTVFYFREFPVLSLTTRRGHYATTAASLTSPDRMFFRYHDWVMQNYYDGAEAKQDRKPVRSPAFRRKLGVKANSVNPNYSA